MEVAWKPQAKQEIALVRIEDEILFGGARGGGKTDAGMAWLLYDIDKPRYRALVIRRNANDLDDWTERARHFYAPCKGEVSGSPAKIKFPSGATIVTGHLKDENAYTKYQGHEYQKELIEELTHIAREDDYEKLLGSCRSTVDGITPQVFATTNPDGPGFKWVKKRWNIPDYPTDLVITTANQRTRVFVPSRLEDNQILRTKDPKYELYLESIQDEDLKKAWREGYWGGVTKRGTVYGDLWNELVKAGRCRKIEYDPSLPTYSSWDFGIGDATAIGIYQIQPAIKREIRLIDYYENVNQELQHYIDWLKNKPYKLAMSYGDPSGQNRLLNTGRSIFEDLNSEKVAKYLGYSIRMFARRGHNIDKFEAVRKLLKELWVDERLTKFIENITNYHFIWDEKKGEYQNEPYHDWSSHGMDQLGYFAVNFLTPQALTPIEQKIRELNKVNFDLSPDYYANRIS